MRAFFERLGIRSCTGEFDFLPLICYALVASPTIFKWKGYRLYFFSREESKIHVHVFCAEGETEFWLDPEVELAMNYRLTPNQITQIEKVARSIALWCG